MRETTRRASARLARFHNRLPWVGPVVFVSSALYFFAQIFVAWVFHPSYSLVSNTISDLGNTECGRYGTGYVCSPRHLYMDAAFIFLGIVMATGSVLLYYEFAQKRRVERNAARIGFTCVAVGGVGAIIVGAFPENTIGVMHIVGAGLAIGVSNLGIFILGAVLDLPEAMRRYMLLFSAISATALLLFASHKYFGIGAGTMERVAAYPETIWLITFGLYIWRFHREDVSPSKALPDQA